MNWAYTGYEVVLKNISSTVGSKYYIKNGEWDLLDTQAKNYTSYYGVPYSELWFSLHFKRKPLYMIVNIVLPCCVLTFLSLFMFCLPCDSGEKVALGVTIVLSFSVFLLLIQQSMPETSDYVPLIGESTF